MLTKKISLSVALLCLTAAYPGFSAAAEAPKKETAKTAPKAAKTSKDAGAKDTGAKQAKNDASPGKGTKDETKPAGAAPGGNSLKQVLQESPTEQGGPLYIKSDTLELNSKERIFTYKGNVEVVRNDVTITSNVMDGFYDDQNKLQKLVATGNVVITKGDTMRSTANHAVYNVASATIELTEGPELYRDGNALAADKVTMFINEDRSEAEGNVRVKVIKPDEAGQ